MTLIDQVLSEPEFQDVPPVLVDVGAAGGVPRAWKRIARHCVVLAFEPDARESSPLTLEQRSFRRWVFTPAVVVSEPSPKGTITLHLTRSPQCSSTLLPSHEGLRKWAFAPFFDVIERKDFPATTLVAALEAHGLRTLDWLKCDTQGVDLRLFKSLPFERRDQLLQTQFEPGLIDAYIGEDSIPQVLDAMRSEPFWLAEFAVEKTPLTHKGRPPSAWYRRLAPSAPAWANLCYLRDIQEKAAALDRRAHLLLWVFAMLQRQPAYAHSIAVAGNKQYGGKIFSKMERASDRSLYWMMIRRFPGWLKSRIFRSF